MKKSFTESFNEIYPNLEIRYSIKREFDVLNEFVQFSDNTRDITLQTQIYEQMQISNNRILKIISDYESRIKKDTMESSN